jgi:D-3-phosphoglycerate dehydrogenase/(S)-sulfolactate dehydrogenase
VAAFPDSSTPEHEPVPAVAVVEDVSGGALDRLAAEMPVLADPDAWADPGTLARAAGQARALVVRNRTQVTRQLLEESPSLEVVARAGVGLDNVDLAAADDLGVVVVTAAGANATSVAEHALAMALALARDLAGHDQRVRAGRWERRLGRELAGRCWGVVGLGATGTATAALASALGMEVVGYDPFIPPDQATPVERVDDLGSLLWRADVVSLHLALSPDTARLIDRAALARMRPGSYLVNVARGGLVDEAALLQALRDGPLAGAALDVRESEPPATGDLEEERRVLLTPHVAGLTVEAQERVVSTVTDDLRRVLAGEEARGAAGAHRRPARFRMA